MTLNYFMRAALFIAIIITLVLGIAVLAGYEYGEDIDVNSARIRHYRRIGSYVIEESIEETSFSQLVAEYSSTEPNWKRVSSYRIGESISPHYRFHNIPWLLDSFVRHRSQLDLQSDEYRRTAASILSLMMREKAEKVDELVRGFTRSNPATQAPVPEK